MKTYWNVKQTVAVILTLTFIVIVAFLAPATGETPPPAAPTATATPSADVLAGLRDQIWKGQRDYFRMVAQHKAVVEQNVADEQKAAELLNKLLQAAQTSCTGQGQNFDTETVRCVAPQQAAAPKPVVPSAPKGRP